MMGLRTFLNTHFDSKQCNGKVGCIKYKLADMFDVIDD